MSAVEETSQYGPGYYIFEEDVVIEFEHAIDYVREGFKGRIPERALEKIIEAMWEKHTELEEAFNKMEFKDKDETDTIVSKRIGRIKVKEQVPIKFESVLIDFFNSLDMGTAPNGVRFQDTPECQVFFKDGFSKLTAGVSLFNIFANTYKLKNQTKEVKLNPEQRSMITPALEKMISTYKGKNNLDDITNLENGILIGKYYMSILAFYSVKNSDETFEHCERVNNMSKFLKETNENLTKKISSV